jgi:hypothetical protein
MMYSRSLTLAVLVAASLSFGALRANAQVLLDGSFEAQAVAPNMGVQGAGPDWVSGNASLIANDFSNLGNTPYGNQYLGLNVGSFATQTITGFVQGETYVLGADFASLAANSNGAPTFTLSISGAATDSGTFSFAGSSGPYGSGTIPFQSTVLLFTAGSSGSATVTLFSPNATLAVDNVALYGNAPIAPTAPEPSTYAEMLLGLGALVTVVGMRRKIVRA